MIKNFICAIVAICFMQNCFGQMQRYTSAQNNYYWKNRAPYAGYWQQDVYYNIKASLDEVTDIITGTQELTYRNNSPDTLKFVFFHLYQNAFVDGSYLDKLNEENNFHPPHGKYESQGLGIEIEKLKATLINEKKINADLVKVIDNSIMKVMLPEPLLPQSEIVFEINFKTYYDRGGQRRRMQIFNAWGYKHYNGCQWFPKISVYDKKIGWDTYQHLGREFYGDFGDFDVELTLPNNYVTEATGILINEEEVLPDELRQKLDIKNFANKPWNEPPSVIIAPDGTKKTWKYHAENVHDFAFTTDPTYRLIESNWNGIRCIGIAQEPHCARWQNAGDYTAKIIKTFSNDFGMYAYPKMVVADARDGMEYPMITMDGGGDPDYRGLLVHEIGHNWFYGMIGNNETYRALLDEGFTQFLTGWGLEKLEGSEISDDNRKWYQPKYTEPLTQRFTSVYYTYLNAAVNDDDGYINTHSDMFNGALGHGGGYGMVYRKTATMLYNLQYVLGDELFLKAMQHYFNQWKMCHPYPEDFRNSITQAVQMDLNWFFDQWLETDKKLDYKVCNVKRGKESDTYIIKFKRLQRMQSPIDFTVYDNCGAKHDFYIPNTWFEKETTATKLPKWEGWDKLNKTYKAEVKIPCGIGNVQIDTSFRLADINQLNNSLTTPIKLQFDKWQTRGWTDWKHYVFRIRPDAWYNSYDGVKIGFHLEGDYLKVKHIFRSDFWINTTIGQAGLSPEAEINKNDQASFRLYYKTPVHRINKNFYAWTGGGQLDGLSNFYTGIEQFSKSEKTRMFAEYKLLYRNNTTDLDYLLYSNEWQSAKYNNSISIGTTRMYQKGKLDGSTTFKISSNSIYSDYNFSKANITSINKITTGKIEWNTRLFVQYGSGTDVPNESALFLAGANPEELMDNAYTRSKGFVPNDWVGYGAETNHFHQGGGLNLRGYAGYIAPYNKPNETQKFIYKGTSGASISVEMDFENLFNLRPRQFAKWIHVDMYLFADAGTINTSAAKDNVELSPIKMDAGIGTAVTIKKWGPFNAIKPLTIRFDVPLFLNLPPAMEKEYAKFRFVVGVGRTF